MPGDLLAKGALTAWMLGSIALALGSELYASVPFLVLFGAGYTWVFLAGLAETYGIGGLPKPSVAGAGLHQQL